MTSIALGMAQLCASPVLDANLDMMAAALVQFQQQKVDLAVFPEYCTCLGGLAATRLSARPFEEWQPILAKLVSQTHIASVFGGIPTSMPDNTVRNRSYAVDGNGAILAFYDKQHLFQLCHKHGDDMDEMALFKPGSEPVSFNFKGMRIGLSICFDLRFPELYLSYKDCQLILCTAAFTQFTGQAHWDALLRARAIENQTWFAGVAMGGSNSQTGLRLYGCTSLYDPWGELAASIPGSDSGSVCATVSTAKVNSTRALIHMR